MSQPSGSHSRKCPFCGNYYVRTNWMVRRNVFSKDGKWLSDTHLIACAEKNANKSAQDPQP